MGMEVDKDDFLKDVERAVLAYDNATVRGLTNACLLIEGEAKKNLTGVRVDTGNLKSSISFEVDEKAKEGYVGSNLFYSPFVHQGTGIFALEGKGRKDVPWRYKDLKGKWHSTKGMKPTPFLQDAIDANRKKVMDILSEDWNNASY